MANEYRNLSINITPGRRLGAGAFGEVFLATERDGEGRNFAVKYIKCTKNDELQNALDEIQALIAYKHPNIVKMFDFGLHQYQQREVEFSLLLEYCSNGSLNSRLGTRNSNSLKLRWIESITSAIAYLHSMGIIHQDLKPDNILLTANGVIKVADFGLARRFAQRTEAQSWLAYYITQGVGALAYVAPEMLEERHTYKVDVFSMGILFHAILEGEFTMDGGEKCYGVFVQKRKKEPIGVKMQEKKGDLPVPFRGRKRKLIKRMLKYNPRQRPTAEEVEDVLRSKWRRWTQLVY